jgi:hypothetical protein
MQIRQARVMAKQARGKTATASLLAFRPALFIKIQGFSKAGFDDVPGNYPEPLGTWALMNSSSRHKNAPKPIETVAHYVGANPTDEPAQFIRDLAQRWKARGGTIGGKPRHSDRYLDHLLRSQGTPIRSLTPKLAGRTNVRPADAGALVRLFLSHWDYVGGSKSPQAGEKSSALYKPLLPDEQIEEVSRHVMDRISEVRLETKGESEPMPSPSIPWRNMMEIFETEFPKSVAMFFIGSGQSVLVTQPEMSLIGFRDVINKLWEIDRSDDQERILVWTLDLGRQDFEDVESRLRFMNAESLMIRFKALKRFKERDTDARWDWLKSRAVILLHDTRSVRPDVPRLPSFDPHHILFGAIPPRWVRSTKFGELYGTTFERLPDSNYTVFLRNAALGEIDMSDGISSRTRYALHYFGLVLLNNDEKGQREVRGLELDAPGRSYVEALGTVFVAARQMLGLRNAPADLLIEGMNIDQMYATEKLRHHGFSLQSIEEFLKS